MSIKQLFLDLWQTIKDLSVIHITEEKTEEKTRELAAKGYAPFVKIEFKIQEPTEDEIRALAFKKWEAAQPSNKPSHEFWEEAEQELKGHTHENQSQKLLLPPTVNQ
jgi:hypothetical protein